MRAGDDSPVRDTRLFTYVAQGRAQGPGRRAPVRTRRGGPGKGPRPLGVRAAAPF
jgi:hypothetical protein